MSGWAKKRFWKETTVAPVDGGFGVFLDGRGVKTPAKAALVVPTQAMAQAMAVEWEAQEGEIDPNSMPVTRSANAAIDKVAIQHAEVADMLAEYGGSDLLCYRATSPEELIDRQARKWDPLLDWAAETFGARLKPVSGVMFEAQDPVALASLAREVHRFDNFELAAFHDLVGISGSLILGFAATHDLHEIEALWELSRIDEIWQEEQWGQDEEAVADAAKKLAAFKHAYRFYKLSNS
ncbi:MULTISPECIES: ATP12 family chaperone protein [unclassified Shimia]|uniref:ATP12 family chaperone protein n=1 Tax=unclassified Shimia TaxID=2630038 RepID=UPI001ADC1BE8|nr:MULTISPECIES: ATP12 family protein [unclassified Shimia]MBO9472772.1 ATPase [Shimia sp. R10_1]MDA5556467.1 ATPase [Shimia sp. MMG029]